MDEFASIQHWTGDRQGACWQQKRGVTLGIGDDTASIDIGSAEDGIAGPKQLLLAVDTMVEKVHFNDSTMSDEDIGYKALAANISDIAAMGGIPLHALVAISVPPSYNAERIRRVYDGLYLCADKYGIAIIGGDTTSSPEYLVITVTLTGTIEKNAEIRRSGAKPGDVIFLTGPIGLSAAGLNLLLMTKVGTARSNLIEDELYRALLCAHQRPSPSVKAGRLLLHSGACHSLNDVSDGLASEAWEIAEASGLRLVLYEHRLPKAGSMSAYASIAGVNPLEWMLYGGEDYVLLGTMSSKLAPEVRDTFHAEGLPFYIIGETEAGEPAVELLSIYNDGDGKVTVSGKGSAASQQEIRQPLQKRGYNHFQR
ncbi:thiamine-phosphate kinase [Paenibacillus sp. L3-i20]|uniref:thiamine-phosphate kinase n=1 Tax=Paenibacillus sp. L3-i20 TaxID=2905833 RepID=UPI001EDD16FC|nr:thiamine-phosphate kinase [Paenibacillus sp. L3-i20]GKU76240.1 thiamine-monophosphate kinase [Paenibacillus sp. L3-i20]